MPNYNTDTASADPFYEAAGAANRTADSTTMMDQPGPATAKADDAFAAGAKSVVSRAHFSTFLVKDEKEARYKTHVDVQWKFDKPEDTAKDQKGQHTVSDSAAASELPATIRQRFHEQFPAHKDLK